MGLNPFAFRAFRQLGGSRAGNRLWLDEAEKTSAYTARDMRELGNAVPVVEGFEYLRGKIDHQNHKKRQGNIPVPDIRKRGEQNHHKGDAAGSQKPGREKQRVEKPRYQGGDYHHKQEAERSILFFQNRPQKQDNGKVADEMRKIFMAYDMGKKPDVMERIGKIKTAFSRYGKNIPGKEACIREQFHQQNGKTEQGKRQSNWGIVTYAHYNFIIEYSAVCVNHAPGILGNSQFQLMAG
jgi:hypothetical protein